MASPTLQTDSPRNAWRQHTPGAATWQRTARAGDPKKYFMFSVDTHGIEPVDFLSSRIEKQYLDRIPRIKVDEDGAQWLIKQGNHPLLVSTDVKRPAAIQQLNVVAQKASVRVHDPAGQMDPAFLRDVAAAFWQKALSEVPTLRPGP